MEKKITKNGNSATITLSPKELEILGVTVGDTIQLYENTNGFQLQKYKKHGELDFEQAKKQFLSILENRNDDK